MIRFDDGTIATDPHEVARHLQETTKCIVWYGDATRELWALPPGRERLVAGRTPDELLTAMAWHGRQR